MAGRALARALNGVGKAHPYYVPSLEERMQEVQGLKREQLVNFYNTFYGLNNVFLSVVGDFDPSSTLKTLGQSFGQWSSAQPAKLFFSPFIEVKGQQEKFETPDKESAIYLANKLLPLNDTHPDAPALTMAMEIFGGGFINSRIANRLRQKDGLSYGAGAFIRLSKDSERSKVGVYAIFAPQNLPKVEQAVAEEIQKVLTEGFTQKELDSARKGFLQKARVNRAQSSVMAGILNDALYLPRDILWGKENEAKLADLTLEDINAAFRKYIDTQGFYVVNAGDFKNKGAQSNP